MGKYEIDAIDFMLGLIAANIILLPIVAVLEKVIYG